MTAPSLIWSAETFPWREFILALLIVLCVGLAVAAIIEAVESRKK